MKLAAMTVADLSLRQSIETDPRMMNELGGVNTIEQVERAHTKALQSAAAGTCWYLKMVDEQSGAAAGFFGIWESAWKGAPINEIGWMVLPEFQGRRLATRAVQELLQKAAAEKKFQVVHAFPAVSNIASNALCSRLGFEKLEECNVEYQQRALLCNHWQIQLF